MVLLRGCWFFLIELKLTIVTSELPPSVIKAPVTSPTADRFFHQTPLAPRFEKINGFKDRIILLPQSKIMHNKEENEFRGMKDRAVSSQPSLCRHKSNEEKTAFADTQGTSGENGTVCPLSADSGCFLSCSPPKPTIQGWLKSVSGRASYLCSTDPASAAKPLGKSPQESLGCFALHPTASLPPSVNNPVILRAL